MIGDSGVCVTYQSSVIVFAVYSTSAASRSMRGSEGSEHEHDTGYWYEYMLACIQEGNEQRKRRESNGDHFARTIFAVLYGFGISSSENYEITLLRRYIQSVCCRLQPERFPSSPLQRGSC